jgi:hypothetical protein
MLTCIAVLASADEVSALAGLSARTGSKEAAR